MLLRNLSYEPRRRCGNISRHRRLGDSDSGSNELYATPRQRCVLLLIGSTPCRRWYWILPFWIESCIDHFSILNDESHIPRVLDIYERISGHCDEIGKLPGFDRADILIVMVRLSGPFGY